MAIEAHPYLRRAAEGAGWLVLCLPLFLVGGFVAGATGAAAPFALTLAAIAFVVTAGVARMARLYAVVTAAALFVVLISPLMDTARVGSEDELGHARFGLPLDHVEATLTITPPFPYAASWNPWDDPSRLLTLPFLASCALVVSVAVAAAVATRFLLGRTFP